MEARLCDGVAKVLQVTTFRHWEPVDATHGSNLVYARWHIDQTGQRKRGERLSEAHDLCDECMVTLVRKWIGTNNDMHGFGFDSGPKAYFATIYRLGAEEE